MKKTLMTFVFLGLSSFSLNSFAFFNSSCNNGQINQVDPQLVNPKLAQNTYKLCFEEFTVLYSGLSKTPLWSAEHLTQERLSQKIDRVDKFHEEDQIPNSVRSHLKDYARTGYDRGHMAPSGDMSTPNAQYESFSLANMIPQVPNNNRNLWEGVESSVRNYVMNGHEVYLVTGPIFGGNQALDGGELIPSQIYKAVYDVTTHTAGVYLVNNANGNWYQMISLNQLKQISGVDAFPNLPESVKNSVADLPAPKPHGFEGKSKKPKKQKSNSWW